MRRNVIVSREQELIQRAVLGKSHPADNMSFEQEAEITFPITLYDWVEVTT